MGNVVKDSKKRVYPIRYCYRVLNSNNKVYWLDRDEKYDTYQYSRSLNGHLVIAKHKCKSGVLILISSLLLLLLTSCGTRIISVEYSYPDLPVLAKLQMSAEDIYGDVVFFYSEELVSLYYIEDTTIWYKDSVNNHVLEKHLLKNGDIASFKDMGAGYGRDKDRVYYKGRVVDGADPESFCHSLVLKDNDSTEFARDHKHLFLMGKIMENADYKSLRKLSYSYYCDDRQVYYYPDGLIVENASPDDFRKIDFPYYSSRENVYINGEKIPEADTASFIVIDYRYSKDNYHVYFDGILMKGADPLSFVPMITPYADYYRDGIVDSFKYDMYRTCFSYSKDGKSVFYKDKMIEGADGASFRIVARNLLCDSSALFNRGGTKICDIDAVSFCAIDENLYIDRQYAYSIRAYGTLWNKERIDCGSFRKLSDHFYCDTSRVFFYSPTKFCLLEKAHPQSFRIIRGHMAYDGKYLYNGEDYPSEVGDSFRPLGDGFYRSEYDLFELDSIQIKKRFFIGNRSRLDRNTLEYLGNNTFEDKNGIYTWEEIKSWK